jgi:uncharacterized membrane protein
MPTSLIITTAEAAYQIGALILVGGLFFLLFIVRPVSKETLGVEDRQRLFQLVYRRMHRWQWLGLLLLWAGGIGQRYPLEPSAFSLPVQVMAASGAVVTLLIFGTHAICYFHLSERMEHEHWSKAARISSLVRKIMALNLLLCLLLVLAGVANPYLISLTQGR